MTARSRLVRLLIVLAMAAAPRGAAAQEALEVVSAGPNGEIGSLAEANEIRVVFSEPMVELGRIPTPVRAPFFRITPAVKGTFRWSGTTILIFTPDRMNSLPFATRYEVAIDATATAVSGRKLSRPYVFSFTTPTARLLKTDWYRRGGRADAPVIVALRFNQPVRPAQVLAHLRAEFEPHTWTRPSFPAAAIARLKVIDPSSLERFEAKVKAVDAAASARGPAEFRLAASWDQQTFPPSPDLVVIESTTPIPSESRVRLVLDERLPSPAGDAVPGTTQEYTVQVESAFFVNGFLCARACNPDWGNPLMLRRPVRVQDFARAVDVTDVTSTPQPVTKPATPRPRHSWAQDEGAHLTIEDAGYDTQPPARTYEAKVSADLQSVDGQTLGYTWVGTVENWHRTAFTSFGDGHGVWESSGGPLLPFYSRNFRTVRQWVAPVSRADLMPTLMTLQPRFDQAPPGTGALRRLGVEPDRIQSHGIDLGPLFTAGPKGLFWAAIEDGEPIERTARPNNYESRVRASVVQVTNLGLTVKDSPRNTLILVTRLDNGEPVPGARVSIIRTDNSVFWSGTTDGNGVAIAPDTPLRNGNSWQFSFIVMAEKDGDVAYVGSDWNEGIRSWDFGVRFNLEEADSLLRGSVFTDRGVYRLGEEVHIKAVLRENAHDGVRLLPEGTKILATIRDGQDRLVDERVVAVNAWSSAEWTVKLPSDGSLGHYLLRVLLEKDRPRLRAADKLRPWETPAPRADEYVPYTKTVHGSFLVAAYRRPDFRVDVTLTGDPLLAGSDLQGHVAARYLFGAKMGARPLRWTFTKQPLGVAPPEVRAAFPEDRWFFVGWPDGQRESTREVARDETALTDAGERELTLKTQIDAGMPYSYTLEADVEDVSRQHIANRASVVVHPAPWYIGLREVPYFVEQKAGLKTEVVAVRPDGTVAPGVPVTVSLTQVQWTSVRRSEGGGFYTWDTERKEIPAGEWTVRTGAEPVPLEIPLPAGGYFLLVATAREEGTARRAVTRTSFYVLGEGYTAWARFDHNRIELVPERKTYRPGETARIMIQSPWEEATALVTTEREGIRSHRPFTLTSTQQSIEMPITAADIPNVYVSVLLIKGRTQAGPAADGEAAGTRYEIRDTSDPGKPTFRLGYVELKVEDTSKRLGVHVTANREEYRPANAAHVRVSVKDHEGRPAPSEITLWAVDYGVLSLTNYQVPDLVSSVYVHKALQVMTQDSRQRIISRRVLTPKGETDGGGGGAAEGGTLRRDFRILAFWLGSVATDEQGQASVDVKLPESLTTYRIMAVAGDRQSRFGSGSAEVRVNKPLTLKPAFPRFLAVGDRASFGAVVTSQLPMAGSARVTIRSLDPEILSFGVDTEQTVGIAANGSVEARFDATGRRIGRARVQMTVEMSGESDAFEDVIPVEVLAPAGTVAAYGEVSEAPATEALQIPGGVVPGLGGLQVELSSTAMVGLGEGARYLVEYPYGCAEQRASRTLAMLLAADLGEAFSLPGIEPAKLRPAAQDGLRELEQFQCSNGGFAFWKGNCLTVNPYVTSYVLHVMRTGVDLKYRVDPGVRERAHLYLERELSKRPPVNESWWPSYTAWQAFAVKVLREGGRNQDSNVNRLYGYRDRMPVFALAYLHDAIAARAGAPAAGVRQQMADLQRRITNAILPEGGSAHIEELSDPYLLWFWNSNVRSTAIALNTLVRIGAPNAPIRGMVRWLMAARRNGRWDNTQENALAMEALVAYYRRYEASSPDFRAVVRLGERDLSAAEFRGRSTTLVSTSVPMTEVLSVAREGSTAPLTFRRDGTGTLFYTARLRYASDELFHDGLDQGIHIERTYEPFVEGGTSPPATTFKAADLVRVTLRFRLTKERRYVAVTDPLPAGFEPVESWFATTAAALAAEQDRQREYDGTDEDAWTNWWRRGGFDHVERHDDRVNLFATRLSEGVHVFSYIVRATTAGRFRTAPARGEEMYEPEVFGRTSTAVIEVR
ncbi:MAG TPA: MG2 domain-containing protein [Vicinamibacterales bacterium]|nr:MG2 domain-containing protein [Vicinamibacterales bacterium]